MKVRYLLFLPLLLLSACYTISNHHPFNAVPLEMGETTMSTGISSLNNIFYLGTFTPDSVDVHLHSEENEFFGSFAPFCYRRGLGKGFSTVVQYGMGITSGMERCGYEARSFGSTLQLKAHLIKSFSLGKDLYLAASPALSVSGGVVIPGERYYLKHSHKGVEIPLTLSYLCQNPFQNKDNYPSFVFSGTLRGARDYFEGDMNHCGPAVFETSWYYNQPKNAIDRYAAMAHIDMNMTRSLAVTVQYGIEYGKGKDHSGYCPVFYAGFETKRARKQRAQLQ
ncbi:MAG: hypothetical protein PHC50_00905 [Candidatus Cloacimonetes bacterium]|nr:hypothetical protein [Candidatus Cloacimonadota bacterium]